MRLVEARRNRLCFVAREEFGACFALRRLIVRHMDVLGALPRRIANKRTRSALACESPINKSASQHARATGLDRVFRTRGSYKREITSRMRVE